MGAAMAPNAMIARRIAVYFMVPMTLAKLFSHKETLSREWIFQSGYNNNVQQGLETPTSTERNSLEIL